MGRDPRAGLHFLVLTLALGCGRAVAPSAPSLANGARPGSTAASTPAPAPPPTPAPVRRLANTIRWSTASEVDNFGFDVYRAEAEDGPFARLTATPVPGAQTSDEPHAYELVDETIAAGKAYFYFVESISLAGVRERFTPVIRAPAKGGEIPPPGPGAP